LDIRHNAQYLTWKSGVDFKLYAFQLTQSTLETDGPQPYTPVVQVPHASHQALIDPLANQHQKGSICDSWSPYSDSLFPIEDLEYRNPCTPSPVPPVQVTHLDYVLPMEQLGNDVPRPPSPVPAAIQRELDRVPTPIIRPLTVPQMKEVAKAAAFMQTKPGGGKETVQREMQNTERRVSSQIQKKSTTSVTGRVALASLSTASAARNKTSIPVCTPESQKRKASTTATKTKQRKKKTSAIIRAVTPAAPVATIPKCGYGCSHGGLIEMLQMTPKDTKHYLEPGNYLHGKACLDCNKHLGDMFVTAKNKSLFLLYYCQVDYNAAELDDDSADLKTTPCACVLCVPCYFGREMKKNETSGAANRSSGRGRATRQRS
jgi:hypothetical protein